MDQIVSAVMNAIHNAGMVEIEVSARHVHLTQEHVEVLFGPGAELIPARPLSQPGQYLSRAACYAGRAEGQKRTDCRSRSREKSHAG